MVNDYNSLSGLQKVAVLFSPLNTNFSISLKFDLAIVEKSVVPVIQTESLYP